MTFDPTKSLTGDIQIIENATIVPFGDGKTKGAVRPAAVYDADGQVVPLGQCLRNTGTPVTVTPDAPMPQIDDAPLPGTWLFGGMLYTHFGHMLLESTSRFWARPEFAGELQGDVFLAKKHVTWPVRFVRPLEPLLGMFGGNPGNTQALVSPARVERLIVPPQGFGTGDMIAGSPEYRAYMKATLGADVPAEGADRIYISRTGLFSKRGRYFGEHRLESLLEAEGYRIFHPQDHPIEEQIAQYKAARRIISSNSSALHLAAFFARESDDIAIILRRPGNIIQDFRTQFRYFAGHEPDEIDALDGRLFALRAEGKRRPNMNEVYSVLDFPKLGQALTEYGYVRHGRDWAAQPESEIEAERIALALRLDGSLEPV